MKRYLIQLTEDSSDFDLEKPLFFLNEDEYSDFYRIINDLALIDDFNKNTIVSCNICNSIVIGAKYFYYFINKVFDIANKRSLSFDKYPYWDALYEGLYEICEHLIEVHLLSDEEWGVYFTIGLPDLDVVIENKTEVTDTEGNFYVFIYDEIGILTDPTCSCNQIITRPGRSNE